MENKKEPLFSIITPIYKPNMEYFKECAESVINQTCSNWEWIVIDDGDCPSILKQVISQIDCFKDSRINFLSSFHSGLSETRNKGIKYCKGDYIVFLDCDDVLSCHFIEFAKNNVLKYPKSILSFCNSDNKNMLDKNFDNDKHIIYKRSNDFFFRKDNTQYCADSNRSAWAKVYPKSEVLFSSEQHSIGEDVLYLYEYSLKYNFISFPFVAYFYRTNDSGITHSFNTELLELYLSLLHFQFAFAEKQLNKEEWHIFVSNDFMNISFFCLMKQVVFNHLNKNCKNDFTKVVNNSLVKKAVRSSKLNAIPNLKKKLIIILFRLHFHKILFILFKRYYR